MTVFDYLSSIRTWIHGLTGGQFILLSCAAGAVWGIVLALDYTLYTFIFHAISKHGKHPTT